LTTIRAGTILSTVKGVLMERIYLDLETTRLDEDGSIVELSASYYKDGKRVSAVSLKGVNLGAKITLDALRVNKHTFSSLNSLKTEKQLLESFFDWLLGLPLSSPELAGVNVHFDFHFIKNRAKLYNIEVGSVLPYRLHDITNISRFLESIGLLKISRSGKGNSLKDLALSLGIEVDQASLHSADGDVALYPLVDQKLQELAKQAMCQCKV
jgi:DNA polymerase III epsilon subunit-like protein